MEHLDAKAIRERLNCVALAIATLDSHSRIPHHSEVARAARQALDDIATLVTSDEMEEHAATRSARQRQVRNAIRRRSAPARAAADGTGKI